jgi:DNA-binding NarL/FixJ family response regulator
MTRPNPVSRPITTAPANPTRGPGLGRNAPRFRRPLHLLSGREQEILIKIAEGLRDTDIAADLFITVGTVRSITEKLRAKTGVEGRLKLVIYAYEQGYVLPGYVTNPPED